MKIYKLRPPPSEISEANLTPGRRLCDHVTV